MQHATILNIVSDLYFLFETDQSFKRTRNNRNNIAFNFADNSFIGDSQPEQLHRGCKGFMKTHLNFFFF
jgi:hypothetical protein